jgi:hypothetical protein
MECLLAGVRSGGHQLPLERWRTFAVDTICDAEILGALGVPGDGEMTEDRHVGAAMDSK